MAQRYSNQAAIGRMDFGLCPECGKTADSHLDDPRFWIPRSCDLTHQGVVDRLAQYESDLVSQEA